MVRLSLRPAASVQVLAAGLLLMPGMNLQAQRTAQRDQPVTVSWGAIDGSVRDTTGAWMRGVEVVSVDNPLITTRSAASGAFRIDSIPAGPHLIRFRRMGLLPLSVSVMVEPSDIVSIDAVLQPFPITLSRVTVQAASGELVHLPPGVADRVRTGIGTYITGDQIAKENPIETVDVFRRVAGLIVVGLPGREIIYNTRGTQTINGAGCPSGMAVVLDGVPLSGALEDPGSGLRAGANEGAMGVLRSIPPRDIGAIEIYKDGAESPASLISSPCGTIYVWTKSG